MPLEVAQFMVAIAAFGAVFLWLAPVRECPKCDHCTYAQKKRDQDKLYRIHVGWHRGHASAYAHVCVLCREESGRVPPPSGSPNDKEN